jgi:MFS family permease
VVYLLTYTSFLLVSTSLSDIVGMKAVLLACNMGFMATSLACSLARNMTQLLVFRALQGATASGLYNLPFVFVLKVVEPERVSKFTTIIGGIFTVANLLGPVLGGLFATYGKWRMMFTMNVPLGTIAFVLLYVAAPEEPGPLFDKTRLRRMDWWGGLLSVGWAAPLVLALQEGGDAWAWDSRVMKILLVLGALLLLMFITYESLFVTKRKNKIDPVLPCSMFRVAPVFWLMMVSPRKLTC